MNGRLIIVGAGPIGLQVALSAKERGFDTTVLERGRIGASLLRWGQTRFFSPFSMNVGARAQAALQSPPAPDALLSGPQMVEKVLRPLATGPLKGMVHEHHEVLSVGRARMTRKEMVGNPLRAERPFRLLVRTPQGERYFEAEHLLDASGVTRPTAAGSGGVPALGERAVAGRLIRYLGDLHERLPKLAGKRIAVIGHGHSAANALCVLDQLAQEAPQTRVTWIVRTMKKKPCLEVAEDPLPERQQIVSRANALASKPPEYLKVERRAHLMELSPAGEGLSLGLSGERKLECDALAVFTGYRPDLEMISELSVRISAASEGARGIESALSNVTDCLSVPQISAKDLDSGEPGFYLVGSKSYGRMTTFLLKNGLEQAETVLDSLQSRAAR